MHFLWQGYRLLQEQRDDGTRRSWSYEPDSPWTPLAAIEQAGESRQADIFWLHSEQNGAPLEVTDGEGGLRWSGDYDTFGRLKGQTAAGIMQRRGAAYEQPLRYAGQYQDCESGLHYNLFRYYEPEVGRFTTQDPIGLQGGLNLYQYAPNPYGWVDPLGLSPCNSPNGYKTGDVDPHGNLSPRANRAPGHTNSKADGFVQSHHPIQDAWAKKRIDGYQRNSAPATLLKSASGSPHAGISAAQRVRRASSGGWDTTLKQEFNISYREMLNSGVPMGQARKSLNDAYKYFSELRGRNIDNPFFDI